jgi:hypothetical protein
LNQQRDSGAVVSPLTAGGVQAVLYVGTQQNAGYSVIQAGRDNHASTIRYFAHPVPAKPESPVRRL